ncbi:MAG TPA: phage portal protein, partial [Ktedonobacterales bacterium]|nr:phage portal protein [Ktedonobacterales bacterium]
IMLHNEAAALTALVTPVDIAGFRAFADDLRANIDEISGVPAHALGGLKDLPRGQLSGVTLRALSQSTLMKTVKKRRLYGKLIREATARMLVIGGLARTVDEVTIELHWEDPLPSDDLAGAQSAAIWATLGVSEDTLMQRNGFQPEIEADKTADEAKRKMYAFSRGQGMPPVAPSPGAAGTPSGVPGQPGDPQPGQPAQPASQTQGAA